MKTTECSDRWIRLLKEAERIVLISHISPDGDTLGAACALRVALEALGKKADHVCDGSVPEHLLFIPRAEQVMMPERADASYDLAVAVDVSDRNRMGEASKLFDAAAHRLVVDHHITNPGFGEEDFVRGGESCACLLVYEVIEALGVSLDRETATALMVGMSTDTGHFQYDATTPRTLRAAAALVEAGADLSEITRKLYRTDKRRYVELLKRAYAKMRFELDGRVGVIALSAGDFEVCGCSPEDTEGIVNRALEVEGVCMAFLAKEKEDKIRFSLRAFSPYTVSDIAERFGGGGHLLAAGCTMEGVSLEEAVRRMMEAMSGKLEGIQ